MTELFTYTSSGRIGLILIAAAVVFLNAYFIQAAMPLRVYREIKRFCWEISALAIAVIVVMVFYGVHHAIKEDLVLFSMYDAARYGVALVCLVQGLYWLRRRAEAALVIAAALLALPVMDVAVPYNLLGALGLLVLRLCRLYPRVRDDLQHNITAYSIQEGIDTLQIGILFYQMDGQIVLVNAAMLRQMDRLLHQQYRNAHDFWQALLQAEDENFTKETYEDTILFRLRSGKSYLFAREMVFGNHGREMQITCTDVTEEDILNTEIAEKNEALENKTSDLRQVLRTINDIQRSRVYAEVTSHVHDVLGQRITIFQQLLKNQCFTDYESIIPLIDGVMADIRHDFKQDPADLLHNLMTAYAHLGIHIQLTGTLPEDETYAGLFVSLLREAFTNAVLHGGATIITVRIAGKDGRYELTVQDNGCGCETLQPGQGLRGMQEKVAALQGTFHVETQPGFTIHAAVGGRL